MKVIEEKVFNGQPENIKAIIKKWWSRHASGYDLVSCSKGVTMLNILFDTEDSILDYYKQLENDASITPLLTEGQLIAFIEYTSDSVLNITSYDGLRAVYVNFDEFGEVTTEYSDKPLIELLWDLVPKVISKSIEHIEYIHDLLFGE